MMSVSCPKCGATNLFDETKTIPTYCSFCGEHLPDMTEYVSRSLKLNMDKQYDELEEQRAKRERRKRRSENISSIFENLDLIIKLVAVVPVVILFFYFMFRSMSK